MSGTRLTPELELEGLSPDEAFGVLGDENRLAIIRALWKAGALHEFDDVDDSVSTIQFTELRRRVDIDDNGKFNYHLSQLTPHFVRQTDDGYRLSEAGKKIARTVMAVSGTSDAEISDEVDTDCPVCGSTLKASYEDQWLRFTCTECQGLFGDAAPEGTILNTPFTPVGVTDRTTDEALTTGIYRCMMDLTYMIQGVCRECAGTVSGSISICDEHEGGDDEICAACETPFVAWGELRCESCQFAKRLPIELCIMGLGPVIGFLYAEEINVLTPSLDEIVDVLQTQFRTSITDNPLGVEVTIDTEDDQMTVVMDENMTVREITH